MCWIFPSNFALFCFTKCCCCCCFLFLINWIHAIVRQKVSQKQNFFFFGRKRFLIEWSDLIWIELNWGYVSLIDLVFGPCFSSHNEFSVNFAIHSLAWLSIIIEFKCFVWVSIGHWWSIFIEIFVLDFDCVCVCGLVRLHVCVCEFDDWWLYLCWKWKWRKTKEWLNMVMSLIWEIVCTMVISEYV